jgi:aspartokinase
VGERWSSKLMASYMSSTLGLDAPFVPSDVLIVTDGCSGNARPIMDATRARVQETLVPLLQRGGLPVVTGFFGASETGKLTTLGRGGSDLSAAVLGHCLDADEVSLWKVEYTTRPDGWMDQWATGWEGVVHDADPTVTIPTLAYEEAAELAHFGKKVLHPETVSPAVEKAIPIAVRNTINPAHPGTRIEWHPQTGRAGEARVQAITRLPLKTYETRNAPLRDLDLSRLAVHREQAALVVLVGLNVMSMRGLPERVLQTLRDADIPASVPARVNGSRNNFSVVVPESRRNEAVAVLHAAFVAPAAGAAAAVSAGGASVGAAAAAAAATSRGYHAAFGARMLRGTGGGSVAAPDDASAAVGGVQMAA